MLRVDRASKNISSLLGKVIEVRGQRQTAQPSKKKAIAAFNISKNRTKLKCQSISPNLNFQTFVEPVNTNRQNFSIHWNDTPG